MRKPAGDASGGDPQASESSGAEVVQFVEVEEEEDEDEPPSPPPRMVGPSPPCSAVALSAQEWLLSAQCPCSRVVALCSVSLLKSGCFLCPVSLLKGGRSLLSALAQEWLLSAQ